MLKYRFFKKITSDVMFEAYGKNLEKVFINAAEALMSVMCRIKRVKPKQVLSVEIKAKDASALMFKWLQQLIALVDIEEMFFSKFVIEYISDTLIKARVYGEMKTREKGETVVKAVTYHKYLFEKYKKGYKVTVSLDI